MHACIHTYIHACMHTYIHTYIYIYIYSKQTADFSLNPFNCNCIVYGYEYKCMCTYYNLTLAVVKSITCSVLDHTAIREATMLWTC